jgi:hypothetical protein
MEKILNLSNNASSELSLPIVIFNIIFAFILVLIVTWVYRRTHRGVSYSQSFVITLIMMSVLAAMAMMILSENLVRALGVLGIFALIRFRTILKDAKDVAYLFFVLAIGLAAGTNNYLIAMVGTAMLSAIIFILDRYNFGSIVTGNFLFTFVSGNNFNPDSYKKLFNQYFSSYQLLQIKTQSNGDSEYYFSISFKDQEKEGELMNEFRMLPDVKTVDLMTGKDAIEY